MSILMPPQNNENGGSRLKFAEMEITAREKIDKNGDSFTSLEFQLIPFFDETNLSTNPKDLEVKKWTAALEYSREYKQVTWPSIHAMIAAGLIKSGDELLTDSHFVSYKTPLFLIPASKKDVKYAKENDRSNSLHENEKTGQIMKKTYPVKLVNIYPSQEIWEADAKKEAVAQPPSQAQTTQPVQNNIECDVILDSIRKNFLNQWLVLNEAGELIGLNVDTAPLSVDPFKTYLPEIKQLVAETIVARVGPDEDKLKGLLIDGFLDFHGPEITAALGEIPF